MRLSLFPGHSGDEEKVTTGSSSDTFKMGMKDLKETVYRSGATTFCTSLAT